MAMNDHTVVEKKSGVWSELVKERKLAENTVIGLSIMLAISLAIAFLSVFVIEEDVFQGDIMQGGLIFAATTGGFLAFFLVIALISAIAESGWSVLNRIPRVKRAIDSVKRVVGKILGWLTVAFMAVVSIAAIVVGLFAAWYFLPMLPDMPDWASWAIGALIIGWVADMYHKDTLRHIDKRADERMNHIINTIERVERAVYERNGYE